MVLLFNLLRGNLEPGVYHLFGSAATGKTTIAMCCAAGIASAGKAVAWISTGKDFSPARFAGISAARTGKDQSSRVLHVRAATPLALEHAIEQLSKNLA